MNAPAEVETIAADRKTRLNLAACIAAGMVANGEVFAMQDWRGTIARESLAIADKLLMLVETGGC